MVGSGVDVRWFSPIRSRAKSLTAVVASIGLVCSVVTVVTIIQSTPAVASTGDVVAPMVANGTTGYTQTSARTDGNLTTTWSLGGTLLAQSNPAVQTMPQRNSNLVTFSPNGINTANVGQLTSSVTCTVLANTQKDCGDTGTITISFSRPVTNPTLHVSGLGGFVTNALGGVTNFGTYFDIGSATTVNGAAATATFSTPTTGSNGLTVVNTNTRLQTTATRPAANCADTSGTNSNGPAGCGSVVVTGTDLTSITLNTGVLATGAADTLSNTAVDAFNISLSVPPNPAFVLSLTKTNPTAVQASTASTYSLIVSNAGPSAATGATVTDRLPANLAYTSANGTGWTCAATGTVAAGQTVTCTYTGSIAAGGTSTVNITVTPGLAAAGTSVRNVAAVEPYGGTTPVDPTTCTANGSPAGCAFPAAQTVAGQAFTCTAGDLYGLDATDRNIFVIDPTSGAETLVGNIGATGATTVNALGITNGTGFAYAISGAASAGATPTVYKYDPSTNTTTTYTGPTLTQTTITTGVNIVAGAINPVNGIFYFGFPSLNGTTAQFEIYGFNTLTNTPVTGRIATITVPNVTTASLNGDFAFDRLGRMYYLATTGNGTATANPLLAVNGLLGATGTDTNYTSKVLAYLTPTDSTFNGMAFDLPTGYLYVTGRDSSTNSFVKKIDPSSGSQVASYQLVSSGTQIADAASCNYNNSLTVQANIVNRAGSTDQFTQTISGGGLVTPQTATTSGTTNGLQTDFASTAGPVVTLPGNSYTVTESGAGTTTIGNYTTTYVCTNLLTNAVVASGSGTTATFTFPTPATNDGVPVGCVFTNTAYTLTLAKTNPAALVAGQPATYTFGVSNTGKSPAPTATVVDKLPAGVAYTSSAGTGWTCTVSGTVTAGQTVTCTFTGTIAAGATNNALSITVTPAASTAGTSVQNKAAVDPLGGTSPVDPSTCTATGTPTGCAVPAAQTVGTGITLGLTKSAPTPALIPGYASSYTLTVTNTGVNAAPGASIREALPAGLQYNSAAGATCAVTGGTTATGVLLSCAIGNTSAIAANGGTASFTISVTPLASVANTNVTNKAAVGVTGGAANDPTLCTATGAPAGCAINTAAVGADVVKGPSPSFTTTVGVAIASIDVKTATTSSQGKTIVNPTIATQPANGTASVNADGTLKYVPNAGFSGADPFTYTICDNGNPANCDTEPVNITVNNVFTPGPAVTTAQNTSVTTPLSQIATTSGKPLDPTRVTQVAAPTHGSISISATTGAVTYTPATGYTGTDSYQVQVCDTSAPVQCTTITKNVTVGANTVTATNDSATTPPATPVTINVRANDTSQTGQPLANPTVVGAPGKGTTTVNADGTITYTPTSGKSGVDTFTYRVCDTSNPTPVCSTATVTVTVRNTVTAVNDSATTPQNTPVSVPVLNNDTVTAGGSPLNPASVTITTAPTHGATAVNTGTGAITYTPANGYTGTDSLVYQVCDGSSPTPVCASATVNLTVGANTVTANADSAVTASGSAVTINVRANDTTSTGQPLANPTVTVNPSKGTAAVNADGTITYTPTNGTSGTDSYSYRVCDTSIPTPVCSTATVTVTVANTVTANNDSASTAQNTPVSMNVLANDTVSANGAPLNPGSVTVTVAPAHGSTSVNATTGVVTYTPANGYTGTDSYTYRVCDTSTTASGTASPTCATAVGTVTVGANTVTANNDSASTTPGVAVTTNVRANDTTSTGQPLANPTIVGAPSGPFKGTTTVNANGTITYTPTNGTSGTDSYSYRVCDTSNPTAVCSIATVTVNVTNTVTAVNDSASTPQNTAVAMNVIGNDTVSANGAPLNPGSVTVTVAPAHGSTSVNATTGVVTYTPANGYTGTDSYTYRVCDTSTNATGAAAPVCATAVATITIGANVVTAVNDTASTTPNTPVTTDVRANDTSSTGQPLANPTVASAPTKGSVVVNANGTITYTPTSGKSGLDTYGYQVCDTSTPTPVCSTATVTVTVTNTVTATNDAAATPQNTSVTTNVLANDTVSTGGAPLDPASVAVTTAPAHGSTSVNTTTGAITFTPTAGYTGTDSYGYRVCDTSTPTAVCATATVNVTVGANTVTAVNDTATTTPGTGIGVDVRANDTSSTGQPLANPTIATAPSKGTATVNATSGRIIYTPTAGTAGVDTFTYQVCDTSTPTPVCSTATVTVTVVNTVTANNDASSTPQNTAVSTNVLGNDTVSTNGPALNPASVTVITAPTHGTTNVNTTTGAITFTPTAGYVGTDTYTYRVCDGSTTASGTASPTCATATVTITVGGNVVTASDDNAATAPVTPVTTDVRANDSSSTGQPLANPSVITQGTKGNAVVNGNGTITYTPANGTSGTDTYRYQVCDTSTPTAFCSTATVTVTVLNTVTPTRDTATTPQNTAVTVDVTANDNVTTGGAPLNKGSVTVTAAPANGTTSVNGTTGAITYTPANGFSGQDAMTYQVCDTSTTATGTPAPVCAKTTLIVTVGTNTVTAVNDTANTTPGAAVTTNVRANDTSATGQPLAGPTVTVNPTKGIAGVNADGTITYRPTNGTSGTDSYSYRVCDTSTPTPVCSTATVTVNVTNTVTASNDSSTTPQNTSVTTTVLGNDTVATNGSPLNPASVTVTSGPAHGSTSVNTTTGAITFTPTAGYSGTDSYVYRVCDSSTDATGAAAPVCATATVNLTVGTNSVTANADTATTAPGTAVTVNVRANDTSATGQALANPIVLTNPAKGTATVNPDGTITYLPNNGTSGLDSFTYRVCDTSSTPVCASSTVTITVPNSVTANNDTGTTPQNTPIATSVLANDTHAANGAGLDPSSVTVTSAPAHGSTSVNTSTGVITYTPANGFTGTDSYGYRVCDLSTPTAQCATATVTITVGANTVTATNDSATTTPITAISINVRANDSSSTGQPLANPTVTTAPAHGSAAVNAGTGTITYTPQSGFSGVDTYRYRVCDTSNPTPVCATATVTVTVTNTVTATNDSASTGQNTAVTTNVLANDTVANGGAPLDPSSVSVTTAASHGSTSVNTTTGAITYTPVTGYTGPDSYTYQVCDTSTGVGGTPAPTCATATVNVTVGANTVSANADSAVTTAGVPVTTDVRANDTTATGQPLAAPIITTQATKGTAVVNPNGTVTYTPNNGTSGTDSYIYRVCDTSTPTPVCSSATVTVTVSNTVTANPDNASTPQNTAVSVPVLANDTVSANGAPLNPGSVTVTTGAGHGTTAVNAATGAITYTPATGYSGPDTFTYQVCDSSTPSAVCSSATVTVTVGVNSVSANNDSATTTPGTPVTTNVRANDTSSTGQPLANPTVISQPSKGTAVVNANGTITYTPANGTSGNDSYGYRVCDTSSPTPVCATASVTVTVTNTVTATNDSATTAQNTPITTNVLANDTTSTNGAALDPTSVTVTTAPNHGTTSVDATTGAVTYTPDPGYTGPDFYGYRVCDQSTPTPFCGTAGVSITVGANVVTANADSAVTASGAAVTINVRANDTSSSGQPLANPTVTTQPAKGTAVVNANGSVTYTPNNGTSGTDTFTYQVCDTGTPAVCSSTTDTITVTNTVTAVNDSASTPQNTAVTSNVLANDTVSPNGAPLNPASVTVTVLPVHGTTAVNTSTGAITYTPANGYSGADSYSYRVCDGSSPTPVCATATVSISVGGNTVSANNDSASTTPGTPVTTDVRANDSSGSGQALANPTVLTQPSKGTAAVNANGTITYTPTNGKSGTDSYTYRVCDTSATPVCASATVTVTVANDVEANDDTATVAQNGSVAIPVLTNDTVSPNGSPINPASLTVTTAPAHGTTSISNGVVTYIPTPGYSGPDSFVYRVCDSSTSPTGTSTPTCDPAAVSVTVTGNTVTANPDNFSTPAGTPTTVDVRANDTSATGQPLAAPTIVTAPTKGTVAVNPDGTITYTPATGQSGTDSFSYSVCDTGNPPACATATATATVSVLNTVTANDDQATTPQNTAVPVDVLANDTHTAGGAALNPASVTVTGAPSHGSTSVDPSTGAITYTPANGYSGLDTFRYQVCDSSSPTPVCASAAVGVSVGTNNVVAVDDSASTTPGNPVTINVRANDTTATGQPLANPTVTTAPGKGIAVVNPDGTITYTPTSGTSGTDAFRYQVCDTSSTPVCSLATVTISVPNTVTAQPDTAATGQNRSVTIPVLTNDAASARGSALNPASVSVTVALAHGSTSVNTSTGAVTYTPTAGYSGPDTFTYRVCDGSTNASGGAAPVCATATVNVTVGGNAVAANGDTATTTPGNPVTTNVRANDTSASGQPLSNPTIATAPTKATAVVNPDGTVTYTPAAGKSGTDSYTYQVCDTSATPVCSSATVTVSVNNTVTANPDTASTGGNTPVTTNVLTNDTVSTGGSPLDPASVTITVLPAHGGTSVNTTTGAITYTPAAGFAGTDSYSYRVCDGSTPAAVCDVATVSVTVGANTVSANPDSASTTPITPVTTDVRANDSSATGQPLANPTVLAGRGPTKGTAVVNPNGTITYTPRSGTSGTDSYRYQVCDTSATPVCATATVTVTVTNTITAAPDSATVAQNGTVTTSVLANDTVSDGGAPLDPSSVTVSTAPNHGTTAVSPSTGAVTYTPAAGYSGPDAYSYTVCDASTPTPTCATGTVSITVSGNTVTVQPDSASTTPGNPVTTNVRANDTSSSGQSFANPTITGAPAHGSVVVNPDGTVTYTPAVGFSGTDSYTYRICDTSTPAVCGSATVTVAVTNTVTAHDDSAAVAENGAVTIPVLANDTISANGAPLDPSSVTVTVLPRHGSTSVNPTTGAISYAPTSGYSGPDSFSYRVCDTSTPTPVCSTATVTVEVGANTVSANGDSASTTPGNPVTTDVRANDTTSTGQPLANPTVVTAPTKGTAVVNPDGTVTYTPTAGKSGTDSYTYRVCDTSATPVCGTATVTVSVTNTVTAVSDSATVAQNGTVAISVLANDTVSAGGAPLNKGSVTVTTAPTHGTTSINATTGAITYTPAAGYSGPDTLSYRVCDTSTTASGTAAPVCDTAVVSLTVSANTVTGQPDSATTTPGHAVTTDVRANDRSGSGQPLANPTISVAPTKGTAVVNPDGTITYTPASGQSGTDSYTYQVCDTGTPATCGTAVVTVTVTNTVTANADSVAVTQNASVSSDVLANDTVAPGGAPLNPASVTVTAGPSHGTTSVDTTTGRITYTPTPGYSGPDNYTYQVCDGSTPTPVCATAAVSVDVGGDSVAVNTDSATTNPGNPVTTNVRANDSSSTGQPLAAPTVTVDPTKGSAVVNPDGTITYTPNDGTSGTDHYTYQVCDTGTPPACGTAEVTVTVANTVTATPDSATVAFDGSVSTDVLSNDTVSAHGAPLNPASVAVIGAPAHGTTSVNTTTGAITYIPTVGYSGPDSFTYQVCDSSTPTAVCATATVTVDVTPDQVVATPDSGSTAPGNPVTINVKSNDSSQAGRRLGSPRILVGPTKGTAVVNADGTITYTPTAGTSGVDSLSYQICDNSTPAECADSTVTINVVNTVTAQADSASTAQNVPVTTDVLANDTVSPGGAPLDPRSVTVTTNPVHGTTSVNLATGAITYTPAAGFAGPDSYTYQVCDTSTPAPVCSTATVTIDVGGNTVSASNDSATTPAHTPVTINVRANDSSGTGQPLANPTVLTQPGHGQAVANADGTITYTPAADFTGQDSFTYRVCDTSTPSPVCSTATVTVTVANGVTATDDSATTPQNHAVIVNVLANDTHTPGGAPLDPSSVTVLTGPAHGTAAVNPTTGAITYTPADDYSGPDTLTYRVCDTSAPTPVCDTATVTLTVRPNVVHAVPDKSRTAQDSAVITDVLANDTVSAGGAPLDPGSVTVTTAPAHGTTTVNPVTGAITYTPAAGYAGTDTYRYRVCDTSTPTPVCATTTVTVTIVAPGVGALVLHKSGSVVGSAVVGAKVHWVIRVTNTGTAAVTAIHVSDAKAGTVSCPSTALAAGASETCTVPDHTITAADLAAGATTNSAFATGQTSSGPISTAVMTASVTLTPPNSGVDGAGSNNPPPSTGGGGLPFTGTQDAAIVLAGLFAVLAGLILAFAGRRRRRQE